MFPTRLQLQVKRYNPNGSKNRHGNAVASYDEPVDWLVHSIAPGAPGAPSATEEPNQPNRDLSVIVCTVYAPVNATLPGERDRVVISTGKYAGEYDVNGRPDDWSQAAPWASTLDAIAAVELKRTEG
jgi:hypothetical protein